MPVTRSGPYLNASRFAFLVLFILKRSGRLGTAEVEDWPYLHFF